MLFVLLFTPFEWLNAATVFNENFNSAAGTLLVSSGDSSERWPGTNYYTGAVVPGWVFNTGALVAENVSNTGDRAILLNESGGHGAMSTVINLTAGTNYLLTFDHWGDNRPAPQYATPYQFTVIIDGISKTITRSYYAGGIGAGESIPFTASATTVSLSFADNTPSGEASAIIDSIQVNSAPPSCQEQLSQTLASLAAANTTITGKNSIIAQQTQLINSLTLENNLFRATITRLTAEQVDKEKKESERQGNDKKDNDKNK